MPEVSIIMPVYNAEAYVEKAVQSILRQSFEDFELIVVDDGSSDDSMTIVSEYASDPRIKILRNGNEGVSAARNTGIKAATGNYIGFVDSDDEVDDTFLSRFVAAALSTEADMIMAGYYKDQMNEKEERISREPVRMKAGLYTRADPPKWETNANAMAMLGYIWNKLYRREKLVQNGMYFNEEMSFLEDMEFNAAVFEKISSFAVLEDCLYHYKRRKRTSLVSTFRSDDFDRQLQAIQHREKILLDWGAGREQAEKAAAYLHVHAVKGYCVNLFLNQNNLVFAEKCDYLNEVIERPLTQQRVQVFQPLNKIDRILKMTIGKRKGYTLALISSLYSTVYNAQRKVLQTKL